MRFIGSKRNLLSFIQKEVSPLVGDGGHTVGDLFSGTAVVSSLFKQLNNTVIANDNLKCCYVFAQASLGINQEPSFLKLMDSVEIMAGKAARLFPTPYDLILSYLNNLEGQPGFIYREYSLEGTTGGPFRRSYFSDENARRIDAIRSKIASWRAKGFIDEPEACLLIADLMRAANRVANISGTYGCFNKNWDPRALRPLELQRSDITLSDKRHRVYCEDAANLVKEHSFDVIYLDPPYTWRHYGAYYHVLETIAAGDEPTVTGKTGLRDWQQTKSRFCDRAKAAEALEDIFRAAQCKHLFLSYNSEGLVEHERIMEILSSRGVPRCSEIVYRRYRSNSGGSQNNVVKERLYYVQVGQKNYY